MSALIPRDRELFQNKDNRASRACGDADGRKTGGAWKLLLSLGIAGVADGLQLMFPPFWIPIAIAASIPFFLLWGLRWEIAIVLVPELAPGVEAFPSWIALALYLGRKSLSTPNGGHRDGVRHANQESETSTKTPAL